MVRRAADDGPGLDAVSPDDHKESVIVAPNATGVIMTGAECKRIRKKFGFSGNDWARALHVASGRTIRKWEAEETEILGPAAILMRAWDDPRCPEWLLPKLGAEALKLP